MKKSIPSFSFPDRSTTLQRLSSESFDLLIIGGGITGAGIALDAASRGMKVALAEKEDFAFGTSSRSTKLIHGGLRYLKSFDFKTVRKIGKERSVVHHNAQHLISPVKMVIPILKKGSMSALQLRIALSLYEILADVRQEEKKVMLSKSEMLDLFPQLDEDMVLGGVQYYEYTVLDSRLVIEVLKTAVSVGALALNYLKATSYIYHQAKIIGIIAVDQLYKTFIEIRAKKVINAGGPWVDELCDMDSHKTEKRLHLSKGIHIIISGNKLILDGAVYFPGSDKRMLFAIPLGKNVYIGTTETTFSGDIDRPTILKDEQDYLITSVNKLFTKSNLQLTDIVASYSGIRPLIEKRGKAPGELSRRDELFFSPSGLITIAGGKLSGYRLMAKKAVDIISRQLKTSHSTPFPEENTSSISLSGGHLPLDKTPYGIQEYADNKYDEVKQTGISVHDFMIIFYRYGSNTDVLSEKAHDYFIVSRNSNLSWLTAEIWYVIHHEMVGGLCDYYCRRTNILHFEPEKLERTWKESAKIFAGFLHWNEEKLRSETNLLKAKFFEATGKRLEDNI